jgi:hypothetical protein
MLDEHGLFTFQSNNFHLYLVRFWTLVGFECVEDVGDPLMMIMSFTKKTVRWEFHHMILISSSTIVACVTKVWDHSTCSNSIFKPAFAFVSWFFIYHDFFDTYKIKMQITVHVANIDPLIKCICVRLWMQYASVCKHVYVWKENVWSIREISRCVHM